MITPDLVSEDDIAKLIISDNLPNDEPSFKAYIEAKVYDKEGRIIQHHRQPMRSLTQYFLALMSIPLVGTYQNASTNQATGILTNVLGLPSQQYTNPVSSTNSANISWDFSIQVGSGSQPFSPTLTSLAAPIANGTSSGNLSYSAPTVSYGSASISVTITVTNPSASTVSITEIGLLGTIYIQYWNTNNVYTPAPYSFLLSYDTFSTPVSIPPAGFATFQITISFTG